MGCVASRMIDKEERVQIFKERKRLMKLLLVHRAEFSKALLAYLRALKNTGVTLRQFTESESLDIDDNLVDSVASPSSPPPPLPPSPPPPPHFSPDRKSVTRKADDEAGQEESMEINEDNEVDTPPPPPVPSSSWDFWDPFEQPLSPHHQEKKIELMEDEHWADTRTEFNEEERADEPLPEKPQNQPADAILDDGSSSVNSWNAKEAPSMMTMFSWRRRKKTLEGIVKDLDEYFLKASGLGKEIAILVDVNSGDVFPPQNFNKRKRSNSVKVFSALSWSWSSKSLQLTRESSDCSNGPVEPCRPGAHCITLEKIFAAEQKLHKNVKEEESTKIEHERKSMLLQKQDDEVYEGTKSERTRLSIETLESELAYLQQSISHTCASISTLVDEELYPQFVALISGLTHMWRTMHECHQVQNHISMQLQHVSADQITDLTSDYHRRAALQLEAEVESWHNSFCCLIKSQKDYSKTMFLWIQLIDSLVDEQEQRSLFSSAVRSLCEQWLQYQEKIPEQMASEAIKHLLFAVQSILEQQAQEVDLCKRSSKLEKRLQKELNSLDELEKRHEGGPGFVDGTNTEALSPKHPLSLKRAKIVNLKKRAEHEKAKYVSSVRLTKGMVLNKLKTALPNVFQALMGFSSACAEALEAIHGHDQPAEASTAAEDLEAVNDHDKPPATEVCSE